MGIRAENIGLIDIGCQAIKKAYSGLRMCELGNQNTKDHPTFKRSKDLFNSLGVEHISFDLNERDGALPINLSEPVPEKWVGYFDMVTNYGTSEHVSNQYMVFKNCHDLVRVGGVMIHVSPQKGYWKRHSKVSYTDAFYGNLSSAAGYKTVIHSSIKKLRDKKRGALNTCAVLIRRTPDPFMTEEQFNTVHGIHIQSNVKASMNNKIESSPEKYSRNTH
jgi:hypothetical protein